MNFYQLIKEYLGEEICKTKNFELYSLNEIKITNKKVNNIAMKGKAGGEHFHFKFVLKQAIN